MDKLIQSRVGVGRSFEMAEQQWPQFGEDLARAREFSAKWRFNRTMRWLVAHPGGVRAAEYGAALLPRVLQHVIRYAGDVNAA